MTNKQVIVNKPSWFSDEKRVVGKTRILTGAAMLSAVAYLLQFIELLDQVIAAFAAFFPFIHTKLDVVLYNALPMNILKSGLIVFVTMFLYKPLSPILKGRI